MNIKILSVALMSSLALMTACGGGDGGNGDQSSAVPSADMMSLEVDSSGNAQAVSATPSTENTAAQELVGDLDDAIGAVHDRIDALRDSATKTSTKVGRSNCDLWTATTDNVAFRLQSCDHGGVRDEFIFELDGRPAASTADADYVVLAAGHGVALPSYQGARRGHGVIGYNLDNWTTLHGGSGPQGKIAVGYRAAGPAHSLNVAFLQFAKQGGTPHSARLTYHRLTGSGGRVTFATNADVIEPASGGGFQVGQDGLSENIRVALAWASGKGARLSAIACGGSVGPAGTCVSQVECFDQTATVTFEDIQNGTAAADFSETACPAVADTVGDPPADADEQVSDANDPSVPGPSVDEPAATADETA